MDSYVNYSVNYLQLNCMLLLYKHSLVITTKDITIHIIVTNNLVGSILIQRFSQNLSGLTLAFKDPIPPKKAHCLLCKCLHFCSNSVHLSRHNFASHTAFISLYNTFFIFDSMKHRSTGFTLLGMLTVVGLNTSAGS